MYMRPSRPARQAGATGEAMSRGDTKLSERESIILQELTLGRSLVYIAKDLGMNYVTLRSAAQTLYDKLGADNKLQAVLFALDMGTLDPYAFWGS